MRRFLAFVIPGLAVLAAGRVSADDRAAPIEVILQGHRFLPSEIHVPAGQGVFLKVENRDQEADEFEMLQLAIEKVVPAGGAVLVRIRPLGPGRYPFRGEFHADTAQGAIIAE